MSVSIPSKCGNSSYTDHNASNIFIHSTILLEIPISIFAVYCIIKLTPKRLRMVQVLLLVHQFWVNYYSMMINVALSPVMFFPNIMMYTRGVLDNFNVPERVQIYLLSTAFAGMLYSIFALFVYRHQCVLPESHFFKVSTKTFVIYTIILNLMATIYTVPLFIFEPNQEKSIEEIRKNFEYPPCDLWDPHIYIFFDGSNTVILYFYGSIMTVTSSLMFFLSFHSFHSIKKSSTLASKGSKKRQIGFLYALILMALIPNILLFFPIFGLILSSMYSTVYNPVLGDLLVCSLSIHGMISTLTLIFSHKPYRLETMKLMKTITCKKTEINKGVVHVDISTKSVKY